jgi:multimeric flavodoxin WrbA
MNVIVINGSPYRDNSTTLKITRAFLEGMNETAEIVNTIDLNANPCLACYACWVKTNGKCIQNDGAIEVVEKIRAAEIVIWSVPLYCYSVPSHCKALMDRTLCLILPEMYVGNDGRTHHPGYEDGSKKTILISSAGLPDVAGNFDGIVFQLKRMFGENTATILCAEASLFMHKETEALTLSYLEAARKAGAEYKRDGRIAKDTQATLDSLMIPRDEYIHNVNQAFALLKEKVKT